MARQAEIGRRLSECKCHFFSLSDESHYRVLRKYLNQNSYIFETFDTGEFMDLCKSR